MSACKNCESLTRQWEKSVARENEWLDALVAIRRVLDKAARTTATPTKEDGNLDTAKVLSGELL